MASGIPAGRAARGIGGTKLTSATNSKEMSPGEPSAAFENDPFWRLTSDLIAVEREQRQVRELADRLRNFCGRRARARGIGGRLMTSVKNSKEMSPGEPPAAFENGLRT